MSSEKPADDQRIGGIDRVSHNVVEPASLRCAGSTPKLRPSERIAAVASRLPPATIARLSHPAGSAVARIASGSSVPAHQCQDDDVVLARPDQRTVDVGRAEGPRRA